MVRRQARAAVTSNENLAKWFQEATTPGNWLAFGFIRSIMSGVESRIAQNTATDDEHRFKRNFIVPGWVREPLGMPPISENARPTMPPRTAATSEWQDLVDRHGSQYLPPSLRATEVDGKPVVDGKLAKACRQMAAIIPDVPKNRKARRTLLLHALRSLVVPQEYEDFLVEQKVHVVPKKEYSVYPLVEDGFAVAEFYKHLAACGVSARDVRAGSLGRYAKTYVADKDSTNPQAEPSASNAAMEL
jgi:hypothetical protein